MSSKLEAKHLLKEGQVSQTWVVRMPPGTAYADVLRPSFWAAVAESVGVRDRIRCIASDLTSFDTEFVVTGRAAGGLRLAEFPVRPTEDQKDHPIA